MNTYDKGDVVRCAGTFADSDGTPQDPTAVFFKFKTPGGTITLYTYGVEAELVKDSAGNYHIDIDASEVGTWAYRFYSIGDGKAAGEKLFFVRRTRF